MAYAISTIFVFNVAAVLLFPPLGHLLGLGAHGFGLWAGTAVNDTSSVVAAGYAYWHAAGDYAVVVKLTRTLLIVPIVLLLAARARRGPGSEGRRRGRWTGYVPLFSSGSCSPRPPTPPASSTLGPAATSRRWRSSSSRSRSPPSGSPPGRRSARRDPAAPPRRGALDPVASTSLAVQALTAIL